MVMKYDATYGDPGPKRKYHMSKSRDFTPFPGLTRAGGYMGDYLERKEKEGRKRKAGAVRRTGRSG